MRLLATLTFGLLASLFTLPALALELTDQNVQKWLASYSAVSEWSKSHKDDDLGFLKSGADEAMADPGSMLTRSVKAMEGHKLHGELVGVLKKSGFSDPQEWAQLGDRIISATMAVEMDKLQASGGPAPDQMQQQMMNAMMNNPQIPAAQKAQMQKALQMTQHMAAKAKTVPEQDKAVIKRNNALIKQVIERSGQTRQPH